MSCTGVYVGILPVAMTAIFCFSLTYLVFF